eukprot:CAMPEP_0174288846 /NCGR_PEP_ID=MMETSP0809-20121228/22485_1 /TAXON_ID=73025 ORGANISM="Eutreptiella gymnastica-like, Strain CCMP1594" /NCGR_SAMPLE_ID=MMETSP0809 /ASSEMBLY_ACC=CAM_ASM_000658 /LENGTH=44 /DNA_ID= /DNA_START= /DNA_END= /DNA_ORIENTATION=
MDRSAAKQSNTALGKSLLTHHDHLQVIQAGRTKQHETVGRKGGK